MTSEASILMSSVQVGKVQVDAARVSGMGGAFDPRLVVPINVALMARPLAQQIVMLRLEAALHISSPTFEQNQIGTSIVVDWTPQMTPAYRTSDNSVVEGYRDYHFRLTREQMHFLEKQRQIAPGRGLTLFVSLRGSFAWLRAIHGDDELMRSAGWPRQMTETYEALPFWDSRISDLRLDIERSVWVDKVLPGLGYDKLRLIEIDLSSMPNAGEAIQLFDKARHEFDNARYQECVAICRDIRSTWEQALGAQQGKTVVTVLAEALSWPPDDWHYKTLDSLWKAWADITSVAHHLVSRPRPLPISRADARLCLELTLMLAEYVSRAQKEQ